MAKNLAITILLIGLSAVTLALPVQERVETDPELTAGYFQGDIVIPEESSSRNGLKSETYRWPNRIVYYRIQSYIEQSKRDHILRGIRTIEANSCLLFKEATSDQTNYINVTSEAGGCYSYVGYLNRVQQLNLQDYDLDVGCFRIGTIIHEFLHALGFYHQHSASERDDYVTIAEENITEGTISNFYKYSEDVVDNFGETYDYSSVMHYTAYAFSKNGEMTIVPKQEGAESLMGQRLIMTETDINKLNAMYKCPRLA